MQHAMFPQFTSFGLEIRPKAFARCRKALKWIQVSFSSLSRQFTSIYLNTSKWFKIGLHRFAKTNPFHSGNLWSVNQIRSASSQGVVRCRRETERQTWRNCRNKSYELDRLKVAVKVMWKFWQKRVEQIKVSRKYPSNLSTKVLRLRTSTFTLSQSVRCCTQTLSLKETRMFSWKNWAFLPGSYMYT